MRSAERGPVTRQVLFCDGGEKTDTTTRDCSKPTHLHLSYTRYAANLMYMFMDKQNSGFRSLTPLIYKHGHSTSRALPDHREKRNPVLKESIRQSASQQKEVSLDVTFSTDEVVDTVNKITEESRWSRS